MAFGIARVPTQECSKTLYSGAIVTEFDLAPAIAEPLKTPDPHGASDYSQRGRTADQDDHNRPYHE